MNSPTQSKPSLGNVIPMPASVTATGDTFTLTEAADILVEPATAELMAIGGYLADKLRPSTGYGLRVLPAAGIRTRGNLYLTMQGGDPALGEEGYRLAIAPDLMILVAYQPAGLFRGIQTIRQLLPPSVESSSLQPGPWQMATGTIRDSARFTWRGVMLDVGRHFFGVADVKRLMDLMALYKMNRFHLHLSDDQGWRIMINSWPNLATYGGSTQVGGGGAGYYTQADYADLVAYAQSRYITVVPEIDMPGHTNAALASSTSEATRPIPPARMTTAASSSGCRPSCKPTASKWSAGEKSPTSSFSQLQSPTIGTATWPAWLLSKA
jgi:hexosaminidase